MSIPLVPHSKAAHPEDDLVKLLQHRLVIAEMPFLINGETTCMMPSLSCSHSQSLIAVCNTQQVRVAYCKRSKLRWEWFGNGAGYILSTYWIASGVIAIATE